MGQAEVLKALKRGRWLKSKDIVKKLKQNQAIVNRSLKKLYDQGLIFRRSYVKYTYRGYEWMLK